MRRERGEQSGRHHGEPAPAEAVAQRRARGGCIGAGVYSNLLRIGTRISAHDREANGERQDQHHVKLRPVAAHGPEAQRRLEQERIAEERDEAAEVGGAVEEVGIACVRVAGQRKPSLQKRCVGGDRDEGQSHGDGEKAELPEVRLARRRLRPAARQPDRQHHERRQRNRDVHEAGHRRRHVPHQDIRIAVSGEQRRLEEAQRDRPHRKRPAEHGQHHLGE